ncbi:MAG: MFS transporter [Chitinophagaceae bacterium]|nr:MFS transporter [Chitinophagaceae bacterium]MCW5929547.1 MFS transporter [Chitinophagaceae bacterium]
MGKKTGNVRWGIATILFFVSALNYLDRQVLSVLAPTIQAELGLTDIDYSYLTSAFLLSYTVMYAISGTIIDRLGTRKSLFWFVGGWSAANILHGFAKTVTQFSVFRFLLGATESANFPAGVKAASEWFPLKERALAIGLLNAGSSAGAAMAVPLVSFIAIVINWQAAFVITGMLGAVWMFFWWKHYYIPSQHPRLSKEELALIESDREPETEPAEEKKTYMIWRLLKIRQAWGCFIARILIDPCTYFLIFWIPKYLQEQRGLSLSELGYFAWIPYAALALGTVFGGIIPRSLINRGWSLNRARKTTMLTASLLIPLFCFLLFNTMNIALAILAIAGVMFGHGLWGNITIPAEVFPKKVQATLTGMGGTLGGVTAIGIQLLIGWTVQHISYTPVFVAVGIVYLVTFLGVHFLVGKLGVIIPLKK